MQQKQEPIAEKAYAWVLIAIYKRLERCKGCRWFSRWLGGLEGPENRETAYSQGTHRQNASFISANLSRGLAGVREKKNTRHLLRIYAHYDLSIFIGVTKYLNSFH